MSEDINELDDLKRELDAKLGDEAATEIIKKILKEVKQGSTDEKIRKLQSLQEEISSNQREGKETLDALMKALVNLKIEIPKELDVNVKNPSEPVKEVKVSNLDDIKIPSEVNLKNLPSIKGLEDRLDDITKLIGTQLRLAASDKAVKVDLDRYTDPKRPLSVRLSTGKEFYTAIASAVMAGGGGIPFATSGGVVKEALVDADGTVNVRITGGSSSGTEYTEGDTDTSISGGAIMWEDTSDTLRAVSASKPLPVNIVAGSASGTEYTEGDTDASITGTAMLMEGASSTLLPVQGTVADGLLVNLGANNDVVATNAGTFAVQVDGSALTALQLIDDVVFVDDADWTDNTSKHISIGGVYQSSPHTVTDGDVSPALMDANGRLIVAATDNGGSLTVDNAGLTELAAAIDTEVQVDIVAALPAGTNAVGKLLQPDIDVTANSNYAKKYYTNAGAVTDGIIWSPASGKRWHIHTIYINVSAAATVTLEDDLAAGDSAIWKGEIAANSGVVMTFPEKYPWASGEDAADLIITTSAGNVYVTCSGYEI